MSVKNAGGSSLSNFIANWTIVMEGEDLVKRISGKVAGAYKPGYAVYESGVDTWTTTTSAHAHKSVGWVDMKMRTSSTFGEVKNDDTFTSADNVEIVVGPRNGTIRIGAYSSDLSSAKWYGYSMTVGSPAGALSQWQDVNSEGIQAILTEKGNITGEGVWQEVYIV